MINTSESVDELAFYYNYFAINSLRKLFQVGDQVLTIDDLEFQRKINQLNISVLPDYYMDVLIDPKRSFSELETQLQEVYTQGGGNIIGTDIKFVPGGNGGNVAKTLAVLGAQTTFLTKTSKLGIKLLEHFLESLGVNLIADSNGSLASSVIFELASEKETKTNIMLSSAGSVAEFTSEMLTEEQWHALKNSTAIAITNAQNLELEDLTEQILENIPSKVFVSLDFSDLTPHQERIDGFREILLAHPKNPPDLIVGNETEFSLLARSEKDSFIEAGYSLSSDFPNIHFALHALNRSYLWKEGDLIASKGCFEINPLHVTGAGDAWHAGFLVGWHCGLSNEQVLGFANAVAGYQLSSGKIGNLDQIIRFMNETPTKNSLNRNG
jgi:sugar/nucleoside kinase (ribokinase family)